MEVPLVDLARVLHSIDRIEDLLRRNWIREDMKAETEHTETPEQIRLQDERMTENGSYQLLP
jgi:hypothetical protein